MLEQLEPLCRGRARLTVEDIDTRPEWIDAYSAYVPVLVVDGVEVCHYELDRNAVSELLET